MPYCVEQVRELRRKGKAWEFRLAHWLYGTDLFLPWAFALLQGRKNHLPAGKPKTEAGPRPCRGSKYLAAHHTPHGLFLMHLQMFLDPFPCTQLLTWVLSSAVHFHLKVY